MLEATKVRTGRAIAPLLFAMTLALLAAKTERAQAQWGGGIELAELELSTDDGPGRQLALHYTLAGPARPEVQLHITVENRRRAQDLVATLDHPRGWIPLGRARGRGEVNVTVRATDLAGRSLPMRIGPGLVVTAVELSTEVLVERAVIVRQWGGPPRRGAVHVDDPPPLRGGGSDLGSVAAACDRAFVSRGGEQECLRQMRGQVAAEAIIEACDQAFVGERAALRCLRALPRPEIVGACDRAFVGEGATLRCVNIVGRAPASDAEIDQAFQVCGQRIGERDELACLTDVLGRRRRRGRHVH